MRGVSHWAKHHDKCEIYISVEEILECATSDLVIYLLLLFFFCCGAATQRGSWPPHS